MRARTRDSLARPLAHSASAHNQPGQLWVTKKQMDMEPKEVAWIFSMIKNAISDGCSTVVLWVDGMGFDLRVGWGIEHLIEDINK